jgi:hypothetical protein
MLIGSERVPYKVEAGDNDTPRVNIDGRQYTSGNFSDDSSENEEDC